MGFRVSNNCRSGPRGFLTTVDLVGQSYLTHLQHSNSHTWQLTYFAESKGASLSSRTLHEQFSKHPTSLGMGRSLMINFERGKDQQLSWSLHCHWPLLLLSEFTVAMLRNNNNAIIMPTGNLNAQQQEII